MPQAARAPGQAATPASAAVAAATAGPAGRKLARAFARTRGRSPGMPDPHPHKPLKPTAKQQRYLRQLAEQTGTSFTPPNTKAEASREISRLQSEIRDARADQARDRHAVQSDLQRGAGDSVRHHAGETTGYGSTARWARGAHETQR